MKSFEIPYNFDENLIYALKDIHMDTDLIYCIYVSPYYADYLAVPRDIKCDYYQSLMSIEEYKNHILLINDNFPNKLLLLLLSQKILLNKLLLQFYIDLGFTKFCCGTYELAKILKEINPNFDIVGSITMKVQPNDILSHPEYKGVFDGFVLFWNYNRNFELLKQLPKDYKYILLVNCFCSLKCDGTHHWKMAESDNKFDFYCPVMKYTRNNMITPWEESSIIRPQDLILFYPYVSGFKLQGREYSTGEIIQDFMHYISLVTKYLYKFDDQFLPNIKLYIKEQILNDTSTS